jgi:hypothetical protein
VRALGSALGAFKETVTDHVTKPTKACLAAREKRDMVVRNVVAFNASRAAALAKGEKFRTARRGRARRVERQSPPVRS